MKKQVILRNIQYPSYTFPKVPVPPKALELEARLQRCRKEMENHGLSHLVVYGDREHFANLMYLVHFDPRFEEALLIVSKDVPTPLILVGNEGEGHLGVSPLFQAGKLRYERYQTFSLMGQPRDTSRKLEIILQDEGFSYTSKVGVVGWKYFAPDELNDSRHASDIPSYIMDVLRSLINPDVLVNATDLFISSVYGLRSFVSPCEIAFFEYANVLGSESVKGILKNLRVGKTDYESMQAAGYTGFPLSCHMSIKSSGNQHYGLSSPTGDKICLGQPCSVSIAHWGSNVCRAGWIAAGINDLPDHAKEYVPEFVAPYCRALREWFRNLRIGTAGGDLHQLIADLLPYDQFKVYLNPGHLIHLDEWTTSPIYKNSTEKIKSGMYIQSDIIPRSPVYGSSRMEDGFIIADELLQQQLMEQYPEVYERCLLRRRFMEDLGFELPEEILPLSNIAGMVIPFFLQYDSVMSFV